MKALRQKYISHPLQGALAYGLYFLIRLMSFDMASNLGGWLARKIGPHTKANKVGLENLQRAFPEKTQAEIDQILLGVWDNLGRVAFEFPHVGSMNVYEDTDRFEIINPQYVDLLRDDGKCGLFFSGHFANWEFSARASAQRTPSLPVHMVYREPDNPYVRDLFAKRMPTPECSLLPKGTKGARQALNILKDGGHLALLVDQKMNDGIAVPFFGRDAMTAPAIAQFSLKFDCPIIPMRLERIEKTRFRMTFYPPLQIEKTDNRQGDLMNIMVEINRVLESWIREKPEQWLWLHRRWPKGE